jgi:large subunit ribosomal protein L13
LGPGQIGRFFVVMKTYAPKPRDIERRWYVVDANGVVLGRLASEVAKLLRGKHKPIFAPHVDAGDHVVVVNARGVRLTGSKETKKIAYRHSGYPGGLREIQYERLLATRPVYVVEKAIRGMLPKNRLGRAMAHKLKVYEGPDHPHGAQHPEALSLGEAPRWEGLPKPAEATSPAPETGGAQSATGPVARRAGTSERPARKTPTAKRSTAKKSTAKRTTAKKATARNPRKKEG